MYSSPSNPDLSGVIGSELIQIRMGVRDLQFHFESGWWLCCQGSAKLTIHEVQLCAWGPEGLSGPCFQTLLGIAPFSVAIVTTKRLELHFSGGQILAFIDDSEQFESLQIHQHGKPRPGVIA